MTHLNAPTRLLAKCPTNLTDSNFTNRISTTIRILTQADQIFRFPYLFLLIIASPSHTQTKKNVYILIYTHIMLSHIMVVMLWFSIYLYKNVKTYCQRGGGGPKCRGTQDIDWDMHKNNITSCAKATLHALTLYLLLFFFSFSLWKLGIFFSTHYRTQFPR